MSPQEFWAIAETRQAEPKVGNLPLSKFNELRGMLEG
jgi:hypothetical protein